MKILMIGAGVLGANMAHLLQRKHEITLLVRGDTLRNLEENGLIIRHKPLGNKTVDYFKLVTQLKPEDDYDLILVPVRYTQLGDTLKDIRMSRAKHVLFIGNNMTAEEIDIPGKTVLFGFFQAAGRRHDGIVDSVCIRKVTAGMLDSEKKDNVFLRKLFKGTGIRLQTQNHMGDWLKSHAMAILPLVFASYYSGGDLRTIAKDKEYSLKLLTAMREGYDVVRALGYRVLPEGEYEAVIRGQKKYAALYRFFFRGWIGKTCITDHAMHAWDEMYLMLQEFDRMRAKAEVETPVFDALRLQSGFEKANNSYEKKK